MRIERLTIEDLARFRRLRLDALRDAPAAYGTRFAEAARWTTEAWTELFSSNVVFVAVVHGTDVGLVRGGHDKRSPSTARLGSLWVAPAARGRGVGVALIDAVVAWARAGGNDELVLDVTDDNEPAISLYARYGFQPTGEVTALPPPREHLTKHTCTLAL